MRFSRIILFINSILMDTAWGATEWTAASSDNFELLTTGGARKARAGIQHFEEVRDFFVRALRFDPKQKQKIKLVAFDSAQEWKRFRPGEAAIAFYQSGLDRDTIAMESLRGEVYETAVHEYVHLLLRHSGGNFPVWLNEGLAELYSSMNVQAGKMRVGDLHVGRFQLLQRSKWLAMEQLMEVDHDSPIYRAKSHAGIFYSQSWVLVHMLMLSDQYRAKVGDFLRKVAFEEVTAAKAFQDVYGKTLFKVLKDLEDYVGGNSIKIFLFDYKPEKPPKPETRAATAFEADLAVARLLSRGDDARDADQIFARLEEQNAAELELAEAYGFHLMFGKKPEEAKKRFSRAINAGSRNAKVYTRYAFMMQDESAEEAVKAMKTAVEIEPNDKELRYYLGRMQLQAKKYGESLSTLVEARPVPPEHAVGYFESLAYIYIAYKKPADARTMANRAITLAKSEQDKLRSTALSREIDRWEQAEAARKDAEERYRKYQEQRARGGDDPEVPILQRSTRQESAVTVQTTEPGASLPKVAGKLRRVDCMGQRATLHVFSDGKLQRFTIEDPATVIITGTGANGSTAEFSCGPQKDVPVVIGHSEGVVRTMGFQ